MCMRCCDLIRLLRPIQWLKNLMIFFPPFLGGKLSHNGVLNFGLLPFIAFSVASSSTYVLNDILDRHNDAHHPDKRKRPLPSGRISIFTAYVLGGCCLILGLILALMVSRPFFIILLSYIVIQLLYSSTLKYIVVFDIFCISAGFLLRLHAGGSVFNIEISSWLFLSVFLLALFLGTGKRLGEMNFLGDRAGEHRKTLTTYPPGFLEGVMYMTGGAVMVTYAMFVLSRHMLVYTVPLCCFGLLRYVFRVKSGEGGDPTEALTKDSNLLITAILWTIMIWYAYYKQ